MKPRTIWYKNKMKFNRESTLKIFNNSDKITKLKSTTRIKTKAICIWMVRRLLLRPWRLIRKKKKRESSLLLTNRQNRQIWALLWECSKISVKLTTTKYQIRNNSFYIKIQNFHSDIQQISFRFMTMVKLLTMINNLISWLIPLKLN